MFEDALVHGTLGGETAELYAYGIYLWHGGTRDGFMDLTPADVQIMLMAYTGTKRRDMIDKSKMFGEMFGGSQHD